MTDEIKENYIEVLLKENAELKEEIKQLQASHEREIAVWKEEYKRVLEKVAKHINALVETLFNKDKESRCSK